MRKMQVCYGNRYDDLLTSVGVALRTNSSSSWTSWEKYNEGKTSLPYESSF